MPISRLSLASKPSVGHPARGEGRPPGYGAGAGYGAGGGAYVPNSGYGSGASPYNQGAYSANPYGSSNNNVPSSAGYGGASPYAAPSVSAFGGSAGYLSSAYGAQPSPSGYGGASSLSSGGGMVLLRGTAPRGLEELDTLPQGVVLRRMVTIIVTESDFHS